MTIDTNTIKARIEELKIRATNPLHRWDYTSSKGKQGTCAVRHDGTNVALLNGDDVVFVINSQLFMQSLSDAVLLNHCRPLQDVDGMWVAVNLRGVANVWYSRRGKKFCCFAVPLDEVEAVIKLIEGAK
jgi:hypothetical protein